MISRVWRGWTTPENAAAYQAIVHGDVIPEIEARAIPGFLSIDLMRRPIEDAAPFEQDVARNGRVKAREAIEQRGLAGAIRADQPEQFMLGDRE